MLYVADDKNLNLLRNTCRIKHLDLDYYNLYQNTQDVLFYVWFWKKQEC